MKSCSSCFRCHTMRTIDSEGSVPWGTHRVAHNSTLTYRLQFEFWITGSPHHFVSVSRTLHSPPCTGSPQHFVYLLVSKTWNVDNKNVAKLRQWRRCRVFFLSRYWNQGSWVLSRLLSALKQKMTWMRWDRKSNVGDAEWQQSLSVLVTFRFPDYRCVFDRYSSMHSHWVFTLTVTLFSVDNFRMMILLVHILGTGRHYRYKMALSGHYLYAFM